MTASKKTPSDYPVGYKKPPVAHQFKEKQSGCPSGGVETKRRRKAEKLAAEKQAIAKAQAEQKARADKVPGLLKAFFTRTKRITVDGVPTDVPAILSQLMQLEVLAHTNEKARALYFKIADLLGVLDKAVEREQVGVVVVSPPMTQDEWLAKARATKLPLDPLEGLPGYDPETKTFRGQPVNFDGGRGKTLDDDQS